MVDSVSVIYMTTGEEVVVEMGIETLRDQLAAYYEPRVAPFMKIKDSEGRFHLVNVNEIVRAEGPE